MKIKNVAITFSSIMAAVLIMGVLLFYSKKIPERDMVYFQKNLSEIEKLIEENCDMEVIENEYNCLVISIDDDFYNMKINDAYQTGALIMDYFINGIYSGKIVWNDSNDYLNDYTLKLFFEMLGIWICILVLGFCYLGYLYKTAYKPFKELEKYTSEIAKGNLDFPLPINKENEFVGFMESFDIMREEIKASNKRENEAHRSKKELVANLSHDIKTPVSTIRANCELLLQKDIDDKVKEKIAVIDNKADTIYRLIENLFHATLEELEELHVSPCETYTVQIKEILSKELIYEEVSMECNISDYLVLADTLRFEQVLDNIVNNSLKYAKTEININARDVEGGLLVKIKDKGKGVPEEEMPLITEKFYRAENSKGQEGSGLGLYLANKFMNEMKGQMNFYNEDGFIVELFLQKI